MNNIRLGVNLDHIATVRNARKTPYPDPVRAALMLEETGVADGITVHLREDRRHILDQDVRTLKERLTLPLNLEMAITPEMLAFACEIQPHAVCLVPEKREELTTEGGLNVETHFAEIKPYINELKKHHIRVSLFIDPDETALISAKRLEADIVELHTGTYCAHPENKQEQTRLLSAAQRAYELGLECHAGHGITYDHIPFITTLPHIRELNIGHFLIGEAIFCGIVEAVDKMKRLINQSEKT